MGATIVTGGLMGIGRGVTERLRGQGAQLVVADTRPRDQADQLLVAGCDYVQVDVAEPGSLDERYKQVALKYGSIDGLVNSAGLTRTGPSDKVSNDDWRKVIDVDLSGTFYSCRAAFPYMKHGSAVVNVASIASTRALPGRAAYTAAKFGVVGVTRVLAVEWALNGIRVNAVGPSWTETPLLQNLFESGALQKDSLVDMVPMKRLCTVEDVANAVAFLVSDQAGFITGQTLYVDGGYTWAG